jgi:hypothetical protein
MVERLSRHTENIPFFTVTSIIFTVRLVATPGRCTIRRIAEQSPDSFGQRSPIDQLQTQVAYYRSMRRRDHERRPLDSVDYCRQMGCRTLIW